MNWRDLIHLAREMAANRPSSPTHQAQLRLAVSSAGYAMYHALARSNADTLVGVSEADQSHPEWTRIYVALGGDAAVGLLQEDFTGCSQAYETSSKPSSS